MNTPMESVREAYRRVCFEIQEAKARYRSESEEISLAAVTKTVPAEIVNEVINCGVSILGENRIQEYLSKREAYLPGPEVHIIGHLQRNKVKFLDDRVTMVQSLDSLRLAEVLDLHVKERKREPMGVLVEVNIGNEPEKSGILPNELKGFLCEMTKYEHLQVAGLMTIPPKEATENFFYKMQKLFIDNRGEKLHNNNMCILSMGMSADFPLAIKYGATMVRVGSGIFGSRK